MRLGVWEKRQELRIPFGEASQRICTPLASRPGTASFAPNVPSQHRLTLELLYEDGSVEYESPHVRGKTAALRLESLLDRLADERYEPVREVLVKNAGVLRLAPAPGREKGSSNLRSG